MIHIKTIYTLGKHKAIAQLYLQCLRLKQVMVLTCCDANTTKFETLISIKILSKYSTFHLSYNPF